MFREPGAFNNRLQRKALSYSEQEQQKNEEEENAPLEKGKGEGSLEHPEVRGGAYSVCYRGVILCYCPIAGGRVKQSISKRSGFWSKGSSINLKDFKHKPKSRNAQRYKTAPTEKLKLEDTLACAMLSSHIHLHSQFLKPSLSS